MQWEGAVERSRGSRASGCKHCRGREEGIWRNRSQRCRHTGPGSQSERAAAPPPITAQYYVHPDSSNGRRKKKKLQHQHENLSCRPSVNRTTAAKKSRLFWSQTSLRRIIREKWNKSIKIQWICNKSHTRDEFKGNNWWKLDQKHQNSMNIQ